VFQSTERSSDREDIPMKRALIIAAVLLLPAFTPAKAEPGIAGCGQMQALAQEHANDMARRERLDHSGFARRAARGARAENVAFGHAGQAETLAQWRASSRHAANMRRPGCKGVARAQSRSGRYYWAMVIGQ
jgi:hypothetical protein